MLDGLFAQLEREPDQKIVRDAWVGAPASIGMVIGPPDAVIRMLANTRATVLSTARYGRRGRMQSAGCSGSSRPFRGHFCTPASPKPSSALEGAPKKQKASHLPKNGLE
jgi:hypothetical protein